MAASEIGIVVLRNLAKVERRVQFSYLAPAFPAHTHSISNGQFSSYARLTKEIS